MKASIGAVWHPHHERPHARQPFAAMIAVRDMEDGSFFLASDLHQWDPKTRTFVAESTGATPTEPYWWVAEAQLLRNLQEGGL